MPEAHRGRRGGGTETGATPQAGARLRRTRVPHHSGAISETGRAVPAVCLPACRIGRVVLPFPCPRHVEDPVELHLVQYPGREMRVKETPLTSMDAMRSTLREELKPLFDDKPFAFFGHSMGALTAFELTRELQASAGPLPRHLFLSGRQAPHIPGPVLDVPKLDDATFLDAVGRRYNALPAELLANREILEIVLPSLRADFTLMERYTHRDAPPLGVALTLLNGKEDPWIDENGLRGWERHTTRPVRQHAFAGGHFYLPAAAKELRAIVLATLSEER
jgi:surfactin synthase thioesterase subunit